VRSSGKLKAVHLTWSVTQSVSVTLSTGKEALFCCAMFCVFMVHVSYNFEERVFIYDCYVKKKKSYKSCRRKFHLKFPNKTLSPPRDTVYKLVKKV
jgi:hypothetical protein